MPYFKPAVGDADDWRGAVEALANPVGTVLSAPKLLGRTFGWRGDQAGKFIESMREQFPKLMRAADAGPDVGLTYKDRLLPYLTRFAAETTGPGHSGLYASKDLLRYDLRDKFPGGMISINTSTKPELTGIHELLHYLFRQKNGTNYAPSPLESLISGRYPLRFWQKQPDQAENVIEALARNVYRTGR